MRLWTVGSGFESLLPSQRGRDEGDAAAAPRADRRPAARARSSCPRPNPAGRAARSREGLRRLPHRPARHRGRAAAGASCRWCRATRSWAWWSTLGEGCSALQSPGDRVGVAWLRHTCGRATSAGAGTRTSVARRVTPAITPTAATPNVRRGARGLRLRDPRRPSRTSRPLPCSAPGSSATARCAGSEVPPGGGKLGLYGFGSSAHVVLQIALHRGCEVFVATRGESSSRAGAAHGRGLGR